MKIRCLSCMAEYEGGHGVCPHCGYESGTPAESALHMQPGSRLAGRYTVGRVIGFGGFGVTYIAWDDVLQQRVAIKEYLPSEFATRAAGQTQVTVFSGNKAEQFADGMVKFVEEARRLAQFQNEPGIVRVFDSFEENNTAYIAMEYLDGETLTSFLDREGQVPVNQAIEMLTPVIQSLEKVHKAGIIHRDIAPDNIILTKDGQVKLIDFGAARYATTSHSRSLTVIIKPGYSPEEQYRSRGDQGPHTDVYALGAVLYRMITGIVPPDALERRAFFENKKKDILIAPSKNCKIEKGKETAILNAMNVRVEDRTKSAAAFLGELNAVGGVRRIAGKIKAIDLMKWPLWAKIAVPVGGAIVAALLALFFTGKIGFVNNLATTLTIGENMTRVPSVVNYSVGVAQDRLEAASLTSIISGRETSDSIPANMVLRQGTSAGSIVEQKSVIELFVSAAAEPVIEDGTMPYVAYYTEAEAVNMLQQLGAVVTVEYEYSNDIAEGLVIRASVGADEPLAAGEMVTLYISRGPDPEAMTSNDPEVEPSNANGQESDPGTYTVSLSRSTLSLFVGDTSSLQASGGDGNYRWSSSNTSVATVSNGTVTAVGRGSATITVTSGSATASCSVTVQDYNLTINQTYLSLFVGDTSTLSVSGAPSGASVSWSSSNTRVATVIGGVVTAVGTGSSTVTAQFTTGGRTYSASCQINVNDSGITLSQYSISSFYVGDSVTISASTSPSGQSVSWSSSNTSIATVSNGRVTAVGRGSATITASFSYGGKTYSESCTVSVSEISISLSQSNLSLISGESQSLTASTTPSGRSVTWSSSNTSVATVSGGRVTAVGSGSATITAEINYNGRSYTETCRVTVTAPSITLSKTSLSMTVGDSETLTATVSPSGQSVSWSSSNASVATVSGGRVTAVGNGSATITAEINYNGRSYTATCWVTVTAPSISLSKTSLSMTVGDSETLTATVSPSGQSVSWSSNNTNVATVNNGNVTAISGGSVTITAKITSGGREYSASCDVTVKAKVNPTESTRYEENGYLYIRVENYNTSTGEMTRRILFQSTSNHQFVAKISFYTATGSLSSYVVYSYNGNSFRGRTVPSQAETYNSSGILESYLVYSGIDYVEYDSNGNQISTGQAQQEVWYWDYYDGMY